MCQMMILTNDNLMEVGRKMGRGRPSSHSLSVLKAEAVDGRQRSISACFQVHLINDPLCL